MLNVLIELTDKHNNTLGNHILQVEAGFDNTNLQSFLNSLSGKQEKFKFYCQNERFLTSFEELIKAKNFDIEQKIIVEYEIDEDKPNETLNMNNSISSLMFNDNLYVSYLFSPVEVYVQKEKLEMVIQSKVYCEKLYKHQHKTLGYKNKEGLFDIETNLIVFQTHKYDLSSFLSFNETVYFGTYDGHCCTILNTIIELYKADCKVVNIYELDECINFVLQSGEIIIYNRKHENVNRSRLGFCPVSVLKTHNRLFFGSSESFVYESLKKEKTIVDVRYIKGMLMIGEDVLVLYDQYNIILLNIETKTNINKLKYDDEIRDAVVGNGVLYVAVDKLLYCYEIETLLNNF